ncbi:WGR domain-containing protein [Amorphoplanes digitatis]|uniref:Putative DNA-binding WGR domain protein/guanyl-specific ribonuclease Sa n=1 Tax=Actinoplanes digitatis TaxID=1868 RepID=A0A7W7I0E3_9ACTN|nr:WGR domain-containing protein [Actinoplanes digitatis]MBB4764071.1 putative DNA-binding WGR domain protein/guanyl-specific ribonuclease Sa [Actinoplanes digitatis]GID97349.1 molybdenum metabolism regulator [Actinoplanes digitatis]
MPAETTYLELSEDAGSAHKFYEVAVDGTELTVRFGRIGERGQVKQSSFTSADKAKAEASKKIGEKIRKGYAPAVQGGRARRAVSRRQIVSTRSTATRAPVLWRYASGSPAFGIFVDDDVCMVGNESGLITTLSHDAEVVRQFRLPEGVKCIVADDGWIYAGCDDGNVYDLSGKVPRMAYRIAPEIDIYWLDIHDGVLGVSDADGGISAIDHEDEFLWQRPGRGNSAWMVRCDADAVHHGHSRGVTSYDWRTGRELWHTGTGAVLFGWQERDTLYAGTATRQIVELGKDGTQRQTYRCDAPVYSCATAQNGRYVFAGDSASSIYCFDADGTRLWKLGTGCGSAYSMQYRDERLYIVTTDGSLACIDASESAIRSAVGGTVPQARDVKAPPRMPAVTPSSTVEIVHDVADGVLVECIEDGGRLRVRVVSSGYHQDWQVQFPKGIRERGSRYVVTGVRPATRGGFYRAYGEIRRLL